MTAPADPLALAWSVSRILESLGIAHTIGGSLASSFAGEPRSTVGIDFVAALEESDVPAFVLALGTDFYVDDEALRRAIRDRGSANLIHQRTQLKIDLFVEGAHRWTTSSCAAGRRSNSVRAVDKNGLQNQKKAVGTIACAHRRLALFPRSD